jgi:hypothetical protein
LGLDTVGKLATFPYGSSPPFPGVNGIYGQAGGVTVDNGSLPQYPDGYNGAATGMPGFFTNKPYNSLFFDIVYSETNSIGQTGKGIGTLPATVKTIAQRNNNKAPTSSNANSATFNARALVIYQDGRQQPYDNVSQVNRPYFSLERPGVVRDGALLQTTDAIAPSGSFLRSHYNPRDNTITYYYYDNTVNRWIISVEPYSPKPTTVDNMSKIVFSSRQPGMKYVYKWIPFQYRRLF